MDSESCTPEKLLRTDGSYWEILENAFFHDAIKKNRQISLDCLWNGSLQTKQAATGEKLMKKTLHCVKCDQERGSYDQELGRSSLIVNLTLFDLFCRLLTRRQRSFLLIALLWVVPIFYVIIPMAVGWSCRGLCLCLSQCFPSNHVHVYSDQRCSRSIPPMSNSWLVGVVASWACCLAATIFFLHRLVQI